MPHSILLRRAGISHQIQERQPDVPHASVTIPEHGSQPENSLVGPLGPGANLAPATLLAWQVRSLVQSIQTVEKTDV